MHHYSASVCSRITRFSPKCAEKITVYQSTQNLYQLVKYSLINSRNWIHVMSDVTLHVNMTPLTVENRLLIKTLEIERGWTVEKIIVEFPARLWKWHCLISYEYAEFAKRLRGSDRRRSEWTDSSRLITFLWTFILSWQPGKYRRHWCFKVVPIPAANTSCQTKTI